MQILKDIAYVIPMKEERPFELLARLVTEKRAEHKERLGEDSAPEKMIKTIGNSAYGKLSQGLRRRKVFDTRTGEMKEIPQSAITNPFMAAHVTGLIRAGLAEILNSLPEESEVVSATTDGFITNASQADVIAASQGPICKLLLDARRRFDPTCSAILKLKHKARQVLAWRTRGQATIKPGESDDLGEVILAKAGISVPRGHANPNDFIVKKFIDRDYDGPKDEVIRGRGIREIYESGGQVDFNMKLLYIANRMDFDWKRMPSHRIGTRPICGQDHLFFFTKALPSAEAYDLLRHEWTNFCKGRRTFLKTEAILAEFRDYFSVVRSPGLAKPRKGTTGLSVLLRMFLRGYVRSRLGLDRVLANEKLADVLTDLGFKVKVTDVENALRFEVMEGCLRLTPEIQEGISVLKSRFPTFDPSELLVVGKDPLKYDHDLHAELGGSSPHEVVFWRADQIPAQPDPEDRWV